MNPDTSSLLCDRPTLRARISRAVCLGIGVLLLAAAALKAHQLATEPVAQRGLLSYRWALILEVEFELFFGLWLLTGLFRRAAWVACLLCFALFSAVTAYKGISGESSCGCFGKIQVNPWYTLILDLAILVLLALFRPDLRQTLRVGRPGLRFATAAILAVGLGVPAGVAMGSYEPARLSDDGTIIGSQQFVLLEPARWLGKPFPLTRYIDVGPKFSSGQWTLVLYHHDCPDCRRELPRYVEEARGMAQKRAGATMALIEIPPYAGPGENPVAPSPSYSMGKLSQTRDWFVTTPVVIELTGGIVTGAREGDAPLQTAALQGPWGVAAVPASARSAHNFGFVEPDSVHAVVFTIENSSDKPLGIVKAQSECASCIVGSPPKSVPARGAATVRVDFHAPRESVKYSKRILLHTEDPNKVFVLRVEAEVGLPLELRPPTLDLGDISGKDEVRREFTIANLGARPVHPVYSTSDVNGLIASIPRATIPPGGQLTIPMIARAAILPRGPGKAHVQIHTDCPGQPVIDLVVSFVVASQDKGRPASVKAVAEASDGPGKHLK